MKGAFRCVMHAKWNETLCLWLVVLQNVLIMKEKHAFCRSLRLFALHLQAFLRQGVLSLFFRLLQFI